MSAEPDSDEALLLSGDAEDFGRFYDRYVESLLAYFQRRLHDPEAAADLTAETFAAALAARRRVRPGPAPATAWLFAIAQRRLADHRRRGSVQLRVCARLGIERVPVSDEDTEMIRWLGDEVASQLVDELPPEQRDAIRAHVLEDQDYGEIARHEAISEAAVRQRVSRGLGALRNRLGGAR
jgi:RNA polymerase sigma-70 factor (ECF subfamily)